MDYTSHAGGQWQPRFVKHTIDNHVSYQVVEYDSMCLVPLGTMEEVQGLEIIVLVVLGQESLFAWEEGERRIEW